jgi:hypothetical protein
MPNPSDFQPSLAPASAKASAGALRRVFHALLGLLAICVLLVTIWAPLLTLIPGASAEMFGSVARFRMLGAGVFVALLVLRLVIRPPGKPSRRTVVWGELAAKSGGTLTQELRGFSTMGWTGGTTIRWDVRGTPMILTTVSGTDREATTQIAADVRLSRGFQFHLVQESVLTKVFFSEQLWNIALAAVKAGGGDPSKVGGATSADVAGRLAFMAQKEVVIGDPKFDDAFLLKCDTPTHARDFFGDAGVSTCLHDLNGICKGWQLSLMSRDGASAYQLTLAIPGTMLDPLGLDASRKLMEASIRCLMDRGMLASTKTQAA